jgi:hypothetical protein
MNLVGNDHAGLIIVVVANFHVRLRLLEFTDFPLIPEGVAKVQSIAERRIGGMQCGFDLGEPSVVFNSESVTINGARVT